MPLDQLDKKPTPKAKRERSPRPRKVVFEDSRRASPGLSGQPSRASLVAQLAKKLSGRAMEPMGSHRWLGPAPSEAGELAGAPWTRAESPLSEGSGTQEASSSSRGSRARPTPAPAAAVRRVVADDLMLLDEQGGRSVPMVGDADSREATLLLG